MQYWLPTSRDSMENWLKINGRRKNFLIGGGHITQTQIYRIKDVLQKIEKTVARIESLLERWKAFGFKPCMKHKIEEEAVRLVLPYESLKEMIKNEGLQDRFIFDLMEIEGKVQAVLEKTVSLYSHAATASKHLRRRR